METFRSKVGRGKMWLSRVSRALSASVWTLACIQKALGSHWRELRKRVTCFGWPSGCHMGVALLKQEAEAGRTERRPHLRRDGEKNGLWGLSDVGRVYAAPSRVCRPDVELLEVLLINSTQERGQRDGVALGEGSRNDVCPECVDFGKRTLIKEYQTWTDPLLLKSWGKGPQRSKWVIQGHTTSLLNWLESGLLTANHLLAVTLEEESLSWETAFIPGGRFWGLAALGLGCTGQCLGEGQG